MYLLFDFDGTLVDSFECVIKKAIILADEYKFKKISEQEIPSLRNLSSTELVKYLQVPFYKVPFLIYQIRKHLRAEIAFLPPVSHIQETLKSLVNANYQLGILTSNSEENVAAWLQHNKLENLFEFVHTESSYLSKKHLLRQTLEAYNINHDQTFYIGDETRDIEAARENKVKSIAVTWGYNSENTLKSFNPTHLVKSPDELVAMFIN